MSLFELAKLSNELRELLSTLKSIHGDKWKDNTQEHRKTLRAVMEATKEANPIAAAIPIAKAIADDGGYPFLLLAVAAEMAEQ